MEKASGRTPCGPRPPPTRWTGAPTSRKAQEWLGHANASTTRLYDRRRSRPEDSPTFRVSYQGSARELRITHGKRSWGDRSGCGFARIPAKADLLL